LEHGNGGCENHAPDADSTRSESCSCAHSVPFFTSAIGVTRLAGIVFMLGMGV